MPARRSSSIARSACPRSTKTAIKVERSVGIMCFLLFRRPCNRERTACFLAPSWSMSILDNDGRRSVSCLPVRTKQKERRPHVLLVQVRTLHAVSTREHRLQAYSYHEAEAQRVLRVLLAGEKSAFRDEPVSMGLHPDLETPPGNALLPPVS